MNHAKRSRPDVSACKTKKLSMWQLFLKEYGETNGKETFITAV